MYELMRYWDDDRPAWTEDERAFEAAWRKQPKWGVSRMLETVGPNATAGVAPRLGSLAWAKGTIPAPHGKITVEVGADVVTVDSPVPVTLDLLGRPPQALAAGSHWTPVPTADRSAVCRLP